MKWSYGITTVPERFEDLLPRTLESLQSAGFECPRLFVDGASSLPSYLIGYEATFRTPRIRTVANWILAAWELYAREPFADRYALFQDDFVTYKNLRQYLEQCDFPEKGYWNLYTFPQNEKKFDGWYLSNQLGKGAVALVFSNEGVRSLLSSRRLVDRPTHPTRGWRLIDAGVVESMREIGWCEYVHNPSLVQHIGTVSSMGNGRHDQADTFRGEDFDALSLLSSSYSPTEGTSRRDRIGLVGYHADTGLGELNRQIATHGDVSSWLVFPHPTKKTKEPLPNLDTRICPSASSEKVERFVESVDVLVFCETPYYDNLIDLAEKHGKRTVCVPMMEWMPPGGKGWPQRADLFLCPTRQCFDLFAHVVPCVHFPWPIDTEWFRFKLRQSCHEFLFVNGNGGYKNRKGKAVIQEALQLWPEMPVTIISQQGREEWPAQVNFLSELPDNTSLYNQGDVLLAPHSVDGLGLEPLEAMACGMPVVTTDGAPWNENPAIARIPASTARRSCRRPVTWHYPDAKELVRICRELIDQPIHEASRNARQWAETRSWTNLASRFTELVREGSPVRVDQIPRQQPSSRGNFLFNEAIEQMKSVGRGAIVEIGGIRDTHPNAAQSDGYSTMYWGNSGFPTYSVDVDEQAVALTSQMTSHFQNVQCHKTDGIEFLKGFSTPIGLLYLDGPDADKGGQDFSLCAFEAVRNNLPNLILIDDCDLQAKRWIGRGKGEKVLPELLQRGYRILHDTGRQILLRRD